MTPAGTAVTVETDVRAPLEATFLTIVPIELSRIFRGLGPWPAVVSTREQTGGWDHVGASRIVDLSDGSHAHEQLTTYEPPRHFAYRVDGFTGRAVIAPLWSVYERRALSLAASEAERTTGP
jgi:hypothetical protein